MVANATLRQYTAIGDALKSVVIAVEHTDGRTETVTVEIPAETKDKTAPDDGAKKKKKE